MAHDIEIILSRQWADCLSMPVFIVDPQGTLLFYNEPAENILGRRFSDTGTMSVEEWSTMFQPYDDEMKVLKPGDLPLVPTISGKEPAHGSFWIRNLIGHSYKLAVTSFPIVGRGNRFSGAIAIFWTDHNQQ